MWKEFQQSYVLEGHTASVWAVLAIEDDLILTGMFEIIVSMAHFFLLMLK